MQDSNYNVSMNLAVFNVKSIVNESIVGIADILEQIIVCEMIMVLY